MIKNVFFDRDGTLGELGDIRYPQTLTLFPDAKQAVESLKRSGCRVFIATNQSCIARGTDGGYDYAAEFAALGADDWFICPHDKGDVCACRKPRTGLLDEAVRKHGLKREECVMIGDRETDAECGRNAGMRTILIGRQPPGTCADAVVPTLTDAVKTIADWNGNK